VRKPYLILVNGQLYTRRLTLAGAKRDLTALLARGLKASLAYQTKEVTQ
jgi:hypothetical protein